MADHTNDQQARGLFFVHVMKTGGSSLAQMFRRNFEADRCYPDLAGRLEQKATVATLLDPGEDRWGSIGLFSVHMPAWVAEAVAPGHLRVTVLRDPVARTLSHLRHIARIPDAPDDIEEIYDLGEWRSRLANYQTQLFAEEREEYEARQKRTEERRARFPFMDAAEKQEIIDTVVPMIATGIDAPCPVDDVRFQRAVDRLDAMDEVGVTADLDEFAGSVARRMGWARRDLVHLNEHAGDRPPPASLLARVVHDNTHDMDLYERACARARATRQRS